MSEWMGWAALAVAILLFVYPPPWLSRRLKRIDATLAWLETVQRTPPERLAALAGQALGHTLTMGIEPVDGKPVPPAGVLNGIIEAHLGTVMDRLEKKAPEWLPLLVGGGAPQAQPSNPGRELVAMRWGDRGGKLAKAAGAIPALSGPAAKAQELMQYVQLYQQAKPIIDGLLGKAGGNGGQGASAPSGGSHAPMQGGAPF